MMELYHAISSSQERGFGNLHKSSRYSVKAAISGIRGSLGNQVCSQFPIHEPQLILMYNTFGTWFVLFQAMQETCGFNNIPTNGDLLNNCELNVE